MNKKMSVKTTNDICKTQDITPVKISIPLGEDAVEITVKRILNFKEACDFINRCVFACFDGDIYLPQLRDFAFLKGLLLAYTDCKLPADEEEQYKLLFALPSDFYSKIYEVIDKPQLNSLKNSISDAIAFEKEKLVKKNPLISTLEKMLSDLGEMVSPESIQKLTEMADQIKGMSQKDIVKALLSKSEG